MTLYNDAGGLKNIRTEPGKRTKHILLICVCTRVWTPIIRMRSVRTRVHFQAAAPCHSDVCTITVLPVVSYRLRPCLTHILCGGRQGLRGNILRRPPRPSRQHKPILLIPCNVPYHFESAAAVEDPPHPMLTPPHVLYEVRRLQYVDIMDIGKLYSISNFLI